MKGEFSAGERLTELGLVSLLQASRTPIRIALERLANRDHQPPARLDLLEQIGRRVLCGTGHDDDVESALHLLADLTLELGEVVYDYLSHKKD